MAILTTAERIRAVELIINYVFHDQSLVLRALEAAGATMASEGNKRLALIGDAALRLVLYELGYEDEASIRDMTTAQNTRATNENLAEIGFSLGLNVYLLLNPSAQGAIHERLMATTVEAIIGAVYLDSNRDLMAIRRLIIHLRIPPTL
ncbi:RNAse III [Penicillium brasilianum]|uniref:RNAse III n=1 Tax=Penicillium brasilianum TaxID=104259 RepID=A0A1S9RTC7_PENBI|nr:RNAse III [Penicillium brasilianum]